MKFLLPLMLLTLFSCAHHHKDTSHHHHEEENNQVKSPKEVKVKYDHECACSVMEGDEHVAGKEEFKLEHGDHSYYFSSKEKMEKFKKNLTENIQKADRNWDRRH